MLREARVAQKLLIFEGNHAYLRKVENPYLDIQVIPNGGNSNIVKLGSKIEVGLNDIVIITIQQNGNIIVSISKYRNFGIFEEEYFEIARPNEIEEIQERLQMDALDNNAFNIALTSVRAILRRKKMA